MSTAEFMQCSRFAAARFADNQNQAVKECPRLVGLLFDGVG